MRRGKFTILHLLLVVLLTAFALACIVEQQTTVGEFTSRSPDGSWALSLSLVEHSTLFWNRKTVRTAVDHTTDEHSIWATTHTISLNGADGKTVSYPNAGALSIVYRRTENDTLAISASWGETGAKHRVTIGNGDFVNGSANGKIANPPSG
ncbi:hypothetical protein [Mariniblastus fucicola]|uniref:Lipocalin-like domain-containing protein n=1 Tax=Mariniblastus fucicola TaxID=980251 RepID=A0A5B9P6T3_9BACT|nr:hypothetical protein [Mariniblastus fucicola]QEG21994.1 hypothetical protein MFFC18_18550 [Mariniblastus fucicola]